MRADRFLDPFMLALSYCLHFSIVVPFEPAKTLYRTRPHVTAAYRAGEKALPATAVPHTYEMRHKPRCTIVTDFERTNGGNITPRERIPNTLLNDNCDVTATLASRQHQPSQNNHKDCEQNVPPPYPNVIRKRQRGAQDIQPS